MADIQSTGLKTQPAARLTGGGATRASRQQQVTKTILFLFFILCNNTARSGKTTNIRRNPSLTRKINAFFGIGGGYSSDGVSDTESEVHR